MYFYRKFFKKSSSDTIYDITYDETEEFETTDISSMVTQDSEAKFLILTSYNKIENNVYKLVNRIDNIVIFQLKKFEFLSDKDKSDLINLITQFGKIEDDGISDRIKYIDLYKIFSEVLDYDIEERMIQSYIRVKRNPFNYRESRYTYTDLKIELTNILDTNETELELYIKNYIDISKLLPLKDNFEKEFKNIFLKIVEKIKILNNINFNKFEIIKYLANKEDTKILELNENRINNLHSILNRVSSVEKLKEIKENDIAKINEIKELIYSVSKLYNEIGKVESIKPFNCSIKGIELKIDYRTVDFNVLGINSGFRRWQTSQLSSYFDEKITNCITYIIYLGNEADLLQSKLEQKLLGLI
jgi:hypothetical protein